jgi:hypothetical protein
MMVETPGSLTVTRTSAADAGHRQIIVTLDGEPWVTLMNGQSATREVPPGHHVVKADNTLMKRSVEVDLAAGERATFRVINHPGPLMWLWMMLGTPLLRLTLEREDR